MIRHVRRAGALMVVGIGVVACGGGDDGSSPATTGRPAVTPSSTTAATPTPAPAGGAIVPVALEFGAPLLGGGEFDARTYAGQPLALWFWAPY